MNEIDQNKKSNKAENDKDTNFKYWVGVYTLVAATFSILGVFFFLMGENRDPLYFIPTTIAILSLLFFIYVTFLHKKWEKIVDIKKEVINKSTIDDISNDVKKLLKIDGKIDEDVNKIKRISDHIFEKRGELWKDVHKGIYENHLLKSLVYPESSLYSVTAFVIGKNQNDEATDMLFMKSTNKNGRAQEYDVLGQRMPVNSLPHRFVKSLICRHVHNYIESDIKFSSKFHRIDNEQIDLFTKQVPCPYKIQEESNMQFGGNPFFLDFIYVLEVKKKGVKGVLQSDLKAEWVSFNDVKKICNNGRNPLIYEKQTMTEEDKEYIKFQSQRLYAKKIVDEYLKPTS